MRPRNDLTEDFRTATMKRNPDLQQSLPSKWKEELKGREEYVALTGQIENLKLQIKAAANEAPLVLKLQDDRPSVIHITKVTGVGLTSTAFAT